MKKFILLIILTIFTLFISITVTQTHASTYLVTDYTPTWSNSPSGAGYKLTFSPSSTSYSYTNSKAYFWIPDELVTDFDSLEVGVFASDYSTIGYVWCTQTNNSQLYMCDYSVISGVDASVMWSFNFYSNQTPTLTGLQAQNYLNSYQLILDVTTSTYNDLNVDTGLDPSYYYDSGYDVGYDVGYETGQDGMFGNGSGTYSYTASDSFDYQDGYLNGSMINVNAGLSTFTTNFSTWIVPAIVLVLLLGGFLTIYAVKKKGD